MSIRIVWNSVIAVHADTPVIVYYLISRYQSKRFCSEKNIIITSAIAEICVYVNCSGAKRILESLNLFVHL